MTEDASEIKKKMTSTSVAIPTATPLWRAPPFPIFPETNEARPVPLTYSETEDIVLPEDYRPTKYDVINGRGKKSYNHIANRRFRQLTAMNMKRYQMAKCKHDKTMIVVGIVNSIRKSSPCGGFIKKCPETGRWISMSDEGAREKAAHCLRDMIAHKREESRLGPKGSTKDAEDRIRSLALHHQNNRGMFNLVTAAAVSNPYIQMPPPKTTAAPVMPYPSTFSNIQQAAANTKKGSSSSKRSPRNSPTRSKTIVGSSSSAVSTSVRMAHSGAPSPQPPPQPPPTTVASSAMAVPEITQTFNNFDFEAVSARGRGGQDMSRQQRQILHLLENGFQGSVEDIIRAVQP